MSSSAAGPGNDFTSQGRRQKDLTWHHRLAESLIGLGAQAAAVIPGVVDGRDAESLHAMRVAFRRIVTLIRLVPATRRPPALRLVRRRFAAVVKLAGPRRDLDVAIDWLRRAGARDGDASGFGPLLVALHRRRAIEQRRLNRRLTSATFRDAVDTWSSQVRCIVAPTAGGSALPLAIDGLIGRLWRRVRRDLRAIDRDERFRYLHRLRRDLRALRYVVEFVAATAESHRHDGFISELRRAQDTLGDLCDLRARRRLMQEESFPAGYPNGRHLVSRLARGLRKREHRAREACRPVLARLRALALPA